MSREHLDTHITIDVNTREALLNNHVMIVERGKTDDVLGRGGDPNKKRERDISDDTNDILKT